MAGVKGRSGTQLDRPWHDAVRVAINRKDATGVKRLRLLAERLVDIALNGEPGVALQALKEIGDRVDGRPKQQVEAQLGVDGSIALQIVRFALADQEERSAIDVTPDDSVTDAASDAPKAIDKQDQ